MGSTIRRTRSTAAPPLTKGGQGGYERRPIISPRSFPPGTPRVGIVVPLWWFGGVERQIMGLIRHSRHLIDWAGVWLGDHGPFCDPMLRELADISEIHVLTDDWDPSGLDLVLVWGWMDRRPWLSKLSGRVIAASHGAGQWNNNQLTAIEPYCVGGVAVSEVARDTVPDSIRGRMTMIPNGIEIARLCPSRPREALREQLGIGDRHAVGYVGRFSMEKEPLAAAAAVGALRRSEPGNWVAVLCGPHFDATAKAYYQAEAERLNPGGNIWLDPPDHVGDIYAALDCYVLGSPAEGFCLSILECQACGLPVVCTRVGRIPQMEAQHGPMTWCINPDATAQDIAAQVRLAVHGRQDPRVIQAREIIWQDHNVVKMAREWAEYFHSLKAGSCQ